MKTKKAAKGQKAEAKAQEVTKAGPGIRSCEICKMTRFASGTNDVDMAGRFYKLTKDLYFHYFCLLFSVDGKQKGSDLEGLHGFLLNDVQDVLKSSAKMRCIYCKENNAVTACKKCKAQYHYTCGKSRGALFIFQDPMDSYCHQHWPKSSQKLRFPDRICLSGCSEVVGKKEPSLITPCCGRIYHTECVQNMANSYGQHHYKCPLCGDRNKFVRESRRFGIYIPNKDADWEYPEQEDFYKFQQMGELHHTCDAEVCLCTKGRKFSLPGSRLEIIRCANCGSRATHIYCGKLMKKAPLFICEDHEGNNEEMQDHCAQAVKKLEKEDLNDDDEEDDKHLIKIDVITTDGNEMTQLLRRTPKSKRPVGRPSTKPAAVKRSRSPKSSSKKTLGRPRKKSGGKTEIFLTSSVSSPSSSSDSDSEIQMIEEVRQPFRLFNPQTKKSVTMRVEPLERPIYELNPSFDGYQVKDEQQPVQPTRRPSTFKSEEAEEVLASSSGQMSLPKISAGFSLQGLVDQDAFDDIPEIKNLVQSVVTASNEECIDLCDSD